MKYLSNFYGLEKAKELMIKNKNNLWGDHGLAWSLGQRSIPFFCQYYLQDIFRVKSDNEARNLASFHYDLWKTLEDMIILDEFDRLVLCLPRGHAKSTVVTFALVIWLAVYQKSFYTIVQGKTEADGVKFLSDVRAAFENNEYIKKSFGDLINTNTKRFTINKNELHLANNCKIECLSSTSSLRGRKHLGKRPSYIIADDIAGLDDCITEQAKQKKLETFQKDVLYAGDTAVIRDGKKIKPGSKFIILGTVLADNDFISSLLKDKSYCHILKRGMQVPDEYSDVDDYFINYPLWAEFKKIYYDPKNPYAEIDAKDFYFTHETEMTFPVLWSDKYSCYDLALMYYSDPRGFKSEIMNDASKIGEKIFHQVKTISKEEIESLEYIKTIMVVDPAVETGARNDYTAICVGSKLANSFRYIRKGTIEKHKFDDYIQKVIDLLNEYPEISYIWIEKNTYQGLDEAEIRKRIKEDEILSKRNIEIESQRQLKNKHNKICSIAGKVDSGYFIFNEEDKDFANQILDYNEFAKHDDAPDVLAEFDRLIDEVNQIYKLEFLDRSKLF